MVQPIRRVKLKSNVPAGLEYTNELGYRARRVNVVQYAPDTNNRIGCRALDRQMLDVANYRALSDQSTQDEVDVNLLRIVEQVPVTSRADVDEDRAFRAWQRQLPKKSLDSSARDGMPDVELPDCFLFVKQLDMAIIGSYPPRVAGAAQLWCEAGTARLRPGSRAACLVASVTASRRLVRQAKPGKGGST